MWNFDKDDRKQAASIFGSHEQDRVFHITPTSAGLFQPTANGSNAFPSALAAGTEPVA
jgi:hypothetical protein